MEVELPAYISHIPTPTLGKLYLGSLSSVNEVSKLNIEYVVSLFPIQPITGIEHDVFSITDTTDQTTLAKMNAILDLINDKLSSYLNGGHNVLVHCFAGISRSSTVVIDTLLRYFPDLFLTEKQSTSPKDRRDVYASIKYVEKYRPVIEPNHGFKDLLIARYLSR
jgi:protein tyrosine phosphatase